jgi:site-specific DNA-methyltransferase (adenine-specific)
MTYKRKEIIGDCTLYLGDCLEVMPTLGKVDAVVTDPPYGVTDHDWDIPIEAKYWMLGNSAVVTATEPFATNLINQASIPFKYDLVWIKNTVTNNMNANHMPMRRHERVLVFGNPIFTQIKRKRTGAEISRLNKSQRELYEDACLDSVLDMPAINNRSGERSQHPSQKPVALMELLIKAFSSPIETILDPFMGSGTTGVACVKLGRKFIGIELEPKYFDIACRRIEEAYKQPDLFIEQPKKTVQEALL